MLRTCERGGCVVQELFQDTPIIECLYFCEFDMRFFKNKSELIRYAHLPARPSATTWVPSVIVIMI
jgi:hypothetical protein